MSVPSDQERLVYALEQALERSQVENQQLRDALDLATAGNGEYSNSEYWIALAGTPSEDTE